MPSKRWWCLSVTVPHEAAEALANFLLEMGSSGLVANEGQKPDTIEIQGFFPPKAAPYKQLLCYLREISSIFPNLEGVVPHMGEVKEEEWQESWKQHFPPIFVGKRFLILPPWEKASSERGRIVLALDPGMAFGTGHHPSTQGSLEAIEWVCSKVGLPPKALDLGTGSGILALALAKLGVPEVWAADIDPQVLPVARHNFALNQVSHIHLTENPLAQIPGTFSLIVANILATTLISLEQDLADKTERGGQVILSGFQEEEVWGLLQAFTPKRWHLKNRLLGREGWVALVFSRG